MSLHASDLAWKIAEAAESDEGGQIRAAADPELIARGVNGAYPERDGTWRVIVHGDLRDIEVLVRPLDSPPSTV